MRTLVCLLLALAPCVCAEGLEFEVASIKATPPNSGGFVMFGPMRGGVGSQDPTHITWNSASLKSLIMTAFDLKDYQVSGPGTLDSERFDIAAVVREGATPEQVREMWRSLLTSRFGLKYRIEQREFTVEELVVGPKGHKLVENTDPPPQRSEPLTAPPPPPPPGALPTGKDGKPTLPPMTGPGLMMMIGNGPNGITARAMGKAQPVSALATMIANQVGHPVIDKTGLTGKYDFTVEFAPANFRGPGGVAFSPPLPGAGAAGTIGAAPPSAGGGAELGLELGTAVQQQLGLRLVSGKGKLDVVVVEKIERTPTEN